MKKRIISLLILISLIFTSPAYCFDRRVNDGIKEVVVITLASEIIVTGIFLGYEVYTIARGMKKIFHRKEKTNVGEETGTGENLFKEF